MLAYELLELVALLCRPGVTPHVFNQYYIGLIMILIKSLSTNGQTLVKDLVKTLVNP
jgi:hypothetical protein